MSRVRFTAPLAAATGDGGRWVQCPFDPREVFGQARAPVHGTVNGMPIRSRLAIYGGVAYLGLTKAVREAAGIELGDAVDVVLDLDEEPRVVEVPPELQAALSDADRHVRSRFERLSFTHRREWAQWVGEAKRPETRERRAREAVVRLRDGMRHP
jgi:hypothetical protein